MSAGMKRVAAISKSCAVFSICAMVAVRDVPAGATRAVTVKPGPNPIVNKSEGTWLSGDGKTAVFTVDATGYDPIDTQSLADVYTKDLSTNRYELISVGVAGQPSNNFGANSPEINDDGRFVVFVSTSTNLVPGPDNGFSDIFVRDRLLGVTERITNGLSGAASNGDSTYPDISGNGRYVVFISKASNLVPAGSSGGTRVFWFDRNTKTLKVVTSNVAPIQFPKVSNDGRFVAFASSKTLAPPKTDTSFTDVFVADMATGTFVCASVKQNGSASPGKSSLNDMTPDGRYVLFQSDASLTSSDSNTSIDVYLRDLATNSTEQISVDGLGHSGAYNSLTGRISADGRYAVFTSESNLAPPGNFGGLFLRDRTLLTTTRITVTPSGAESSGTGYWGAISNDGRRIGFISSAKNLDPTQSNYDSSDSNNFFGFVHYVTGFHDLGGGISGSGGIPKLEGGGTLGPSGTGTVSLTAAAPNAASAICLSTTVGSVPFYGGTFQAFPVLTLAMAVTDAMGQWTLPYVLPPATLPLDLGYLQIAIADPASVQGVALSNLLAIALE